jgi:hypothetical protein
MDRYVHRLAARSLQEVKRPSIHLDGGTAAMTESWELHLYLEPPPHPNKGGGGFLINTFLGVNEELPRTNGVFFGSFLGFLGVFGTPPQNGGF